MNSLAIKSPADLQPGDALIIGKRRWKYVGRSECFPEYKHQPNEFAFEADHMDPGACGNRRVHAGSEVEDMIAAGFMRRSIEVRLVVADVDVDVTLGEAG